MKNRRITIVAFLLLAALTLGIGYAAVTTQLFIDGSATISQDVANNEFNEDIYFTSVKNNKTGEFVTSVSKDEGLGYSASITTSNNDRATFTVTGLSNENETLTISYKVKNESKFDATITLNASSSVSNANVFDVTCSASDGVTLAAGQEAIVDVTVKVKTQVDTETTSSISLILDVTSVK
jgi:hypothetical protein